MAKLKYLALNLLYLPCRQTGLILPGKICRPQQNISRPEACLVNIPDFYAQIPDSPAENNRPPIGTEAGIMPHEPLPDCKTGNPALESMLEDICIKNSYVMEPLSSHVCSLQEKFLNTLYNALKEAEVELTEKITIFQDPGGRLLVSGEHSEKDAIERVLAGNPFLSEVFTTLSSHSEIARDIVNINRIFGNMSNEYEQIMERTNGYHLSLRGGMSHFYFI